MDKNDVTILFDDMYNDIYQTSKDKLLIRNDKWELWRKVKGSYEFQRKVMRKDYSKDLKPNNRKSGYYLVEFKMTDRKIVKLIKSDNLEKEIDKMTEKNELLIKAKIKENIKKKQLEEAKSELRKTSRKLIELIESLNTYSMVEDDIVRHQVYFEGIIKNLSSGEIRETKTTMDINKINRLKLYKSKIDNYIEKGKYKSINQLCKDLNINRQTLYNYKLNEYLKGILKINGD